MPDFAGTLIAPTTGAPQPGRTVAVYANPVVVLHEAVLAPNRPLSGLSAVGSPVDPPPVDSAAFCVRGVAEDWVDRIHVIPRRFDFGNILGVINRAIDIFSAFRDQDVSFTTFTNNSGPGLSITDLPGLPTVLTPFTGLSLNLQVTPNGSPNFDTTMDFEFDVGTVVVPITGSRVVMFPYAPETPMQETLEFKTDVFAFKDGTEKRFALRKNPRQSFTLELAREQGVERSRIDSVLYEWQSRVFGLPMWHEGMSITAAVAVNDTVVAVDSTAFIDLRVGGLALLLRPDEITFDAIEVSSFTATSITFGSTIQNTYEPGTLVYPIRNAIASAVFTGERHSVGLATFQIRFRVIDNDPPVSIASTAAFSTYNSKVLLDDFNPIGASLTETYERAMVEFDGGVGVISHDSPWTRNKRKSRKGFETRSRQESWETRQLLHALKGKQTSFYIPSFSKELTVVDVLTSGASTLTITNVGYTRFVQNQSPRNIIRVTLTDGTSLIRTVDSSAEVDSETEVLTLDNTWPATVAVADISVVDFIEKVRLDSDRIPITHLQGFGETSISFPVKGVFE